MKSINFFKSISFIIFVLLLTVTNCDQFKDDKYTLEIGDEAPVFVAKYFNSNDEINLHDFKGKIVLLHFWALWCPPCIHEMPTINQLAKEIDSNKFKIFAITVDSKKQDYKIDEFIAEHKLENLKFIHDFNFDIAKLYQVTGFPESILIDENGLIAGIYDSRDGAVKSRIIADRDWTDPKLVEFINDLLIDLR